MSYGGRLAHSPSPISANADADTDPAVAGAAAVAATSATAAAVRGGAARRTHPLHGGAVGSNSATWSPVRCRRVVSGRAASAVPRRGGGEGLCAVVVRGGGGGGVGAMKGGRLATGRARALPAHVRSFHPVSSALVTSAVAVGGVKKKGGESGTGREGGRGGEARHWHCRPAAIHRANVGGVPATAADNATRRQASGRWRAAPPAIRRSVDKDAPPPPPRPCRPRPPRQRLWQRRRRVAAATSPSSPPPFRCDPATTA